MRVIKLYFSPGGSAPKASSWMASQSQPGARMQIGPELQAHSDMVEDGNFYIVPINDLNQFNHKLANLMDPLLKQMVMRMLFLRRMKKKTRVTFSPDKVLAKHKSCS